MERSWHEKEDLNDTEKGQAVRTNQDIPKLRKKILPRNKYVENAQWQTFN